MIIYRAAKLKQIVLSSILLCNYFFFMSLHIFHCEANGIDDIVCQHLVPYKFHFLGASFPFLACHHEPMFLYSPLSAIFCLK